MIRTKPDSYCLVGDLETEGISEMVSDLMGLYLQYGLDPRAFAAYQAHRHDQRKPGMMRRMLGAFGRYRR